MQDNNDTFIITTTTTTHKSMKYHIIIPFQFIASESLPSWINNFKSHFTRVQLWTRFKFALMIIIGLIFKSKQLMNKRLLYVNDK